MSYLDTPRLTFSGQFTANPSTVNNDPGNYNVAMPLGSVAWNPDGRHNFSLNACAVTSICTDAGLSTSGDPIIGAQLASTGLAVLVDLDTQQQGVSQIFGLTVQITAGGATITGDMTPVNFFDMFARANAPADGKYSAWYQSVLTNVTYSGSWNSPFVQALQSASGSTLSIHFVVDGYHDGEYQQTNFTTGRVVGTIGPYSPNEPTSFINGRFLRPVLTTNAPNSWGAFNKAPAKTDLTRNKITFDFGNAFPTTWPLTSEFPLSAVSGLQAAIIPASGNPIILGTIDSSDAAYATTAFVQEFDLDDEALAAIASSPTAVLIPTSSEPPIVAMSENPTGAYLNYDQYVFRLNPPETGTVTVWANVFEQPAANQTIPLVMYLSMLGGGPPILQVGTPANGITFPPAITTDASGKATFTIGSSNPQTPRGYIDGQVYGIQANWSLDSYIDIWAFVSVKVFDVVSAVDSPPTWWQDVQPILNQYAVLYPAMRNILLINDYGTVVQNLQPILQRLQAAPTDPQLMPITRELSSSKLQIILDWANAGTPQGMLPGAGT
ncbi:MAG TPA: hypothetical protein VHW00_03160 [Thermoanaerobaculia bacterium]|nr:hypothetical protein [Thermoanaerobaculia bacterium]